MLELSIFVWTLVDCIHFTYVVKFIGIKLFIIFSYYFLMSVRCIAISVSFLIFVFYIFSPFSQVLVSLIFFLLFYCLILVFFNPFLAFSILFFF